MRLLRGTDLVQVYYLGVPEGRPGQLHLYCVSSAALGQGEAAPPPRCLTCSPDTGRAEGSYYNQAATDNARSEDAHLDDWEDAEHSTEPPVTTALPTKKDKRTGALVLHQCVWEPNRPSPRWRVTTVGLFPWCNRPAMPWVLALQCWWVCCAAFQINTQQLVGVHVLLERPEWRQDS